VPPLPESIEGRVLIVVGDDVSTGDMTPDGTLGVAIWSNVPACARLMFRRFDREFPARAARWGGGIVVAGPWSIPVDLDENAWTAETPVRARRARAAADDPRAGRLRAGGLLAHGRRRVIATSPSGSGAPAADYFWP
jgi:hypothetical protein